MDASSIIAACATTIAIASLVVSIGEMRATRRHNWQSVRPLLGFECLRHDGHTAGIKITNAGLGPAIIKTTMLFLDGEAVGPWEKHVVDPLRGTFPLWPHFVSLRPGRHIPVGHEMMIFALEAYDPARDADFWTAVTQRITIRVQYESLYGTEHESWFEGSWAHGATEITHTASRSGTPGVEHGNPA
ncbi:hypothetical protein [Micromonospora sp. NPDC005087]|uniref:hypothetical protein n=1 Tax=Micromonospora sp. NPDC005087 TaxID=3364225 RepID=UPI0036880C89